MNSGHHHGCWVSDKQTQTLAQKGIVQVFLLLPYICGGNNPTATMTSFDHLNWEDLRDSINLTAFQELGWSPDNLDSMFHNLSSDIRHSEYDMLHEPAWRGLVITLYAIVIIMGICGNSIVIFIVARNKVLRGYVTNVFITNLAISDIGLCIFNLPFQLYYQLTENWIFGKEMCRIIFSTFAVPVYVSTFTILLIAFDRYLLIVYPFKPRITLRKSLILLALIAFSSLVLSTPLFYYTELESWTDDTLHIYRKLCVERWPWAKGREIYSILMFMIQFCIPLFITSVLYWQIFIKLENRPIKQTDMKRKKKTNRILIAIVALFALCWLPWNIWALILEFNAPIVQGRHFKLVDLLLKVFAMSSACVNPFLYCWLNDNFRKELGNIVVKVHRRQMKGSNHQPLKDCEENGRTENNTNEYTITIDNMSSADVI